ncbi:hypothetical protein H0H93_003731 [Arthromyces matolae]|nr:hypothetical protein H0H93_003731 [Arthromyces matolae]
MSGLSSWLWGTSTLDDAVDKATSELLPAGSEDIALNLEICDQIRSKAVPAKDAMRALKRRLNHKNPNVQNLALSLADICIKNGGDVFLAEIASREFMDNLVSILKVPGLNHEVKQNILRLIQNWCTAFEGKYHLSYVGQVYKTLGSEGFNFPPKDLSLANSAMVDTQTAPEWIDSDVCLRCRTAFTFTNRKHHCRNCGQVFDQACSSKSMALPHFGIAQEVRVCDGCFNKLTRKGDKVRGHRPSASMHSTRHHSARDLADAELQRAIQLSLQEVNGNARPGYVPAQPNNWQYSEPPIVDRLSHPIKRTTTEEEEDDPDLRAAIEASLREANAPRPSAPVAIDSPRTEYSSTGYSQSYPPSVSHLPAVPSAPTYDLEPLESDVILTFSQTIEQVQAQGGRDISRYPAVNELYDKANGLRPKLALSLDDTDRKEQMLADMHEKLSQAVKLYDQILTEQVERPRWRPATSVYHTAAKNHNEWNPPTAAPLSVTQARAEVPPTPLSPQNHYQEYQPQLYSPPQLVSWHADNTAKQSSPPAVSVPTFAIANPQPSQQQPSQHHSYSNTTSAQVELPPVTLSTQIYQPQVASPVSFQTSPPQLERTQYISPVTAPPPPPLPQQAPSTQQASALPSSSPLNRHKSLSYAVPPAPLVNGNVNRSNMVSAPQHSQQHATIPTLPHFPVAPTSAPTAFPLYGTSAPTGFVAPEERKEALLIDL